MKNKIYQIQIVLKNSKPKIWRRVLVPSDMLLSDFHKVIQTTMGWNNSHLHQFIKESTLYIPESAEEVFVDDMVTVDYAGLKISDLLINEDNRIVYEYDFGDGWEHDIILEKIEEDSPHKALPMCTAGRNSCPPEDCGGVRGYMNILSILKDPKHEEYEELLDWLGNDFDPKTFDRIEVNEILKTEDFGCSDFF